LASGIAPGWAFSYPLGIISIMNRIGIVSFWSFESSIRSRGSGLSRLAEPQLPTLTSNERQQIDRAVLFLENIC
jgi:hypothetical protein